MADGNAIDTDKVEKFSARIMEDYGNTLRGAMLYIGDKVGLFKALWRLGAVTQEELARDTGLNARYLREWLGSMVTGGYLDYDPQARRYRLPDEFAPVLADEDSPYFAGGTVMDFGCGSGLAAITMALAYPKSRVVGCDFHLPSIERARANAAAAGVADRVSFEVADSDVLVGQTFDFVTTFVVIHDAADPQQMLRDLRAATADDGTYLMVELNLSEELHENMNLFGRVMYPQSTLYCMTCSLSHDGAGLGAFMGEKRARAMASEAGFGRFRKVPSERPPLPALFELRP